MVQTTRTVEGGVSMDDLISRQAAIDAIVAWTVEDRPDIEMPTDLVGRINALPSTQLTPCDVCRHNSPSAMGGCICPAEGREG